MSEKYLLAWDVGKSTGVALGSYSDTEPYRLVKAWQFGNGIQGLQEWLDEHWVQSKKALVISGETYVDDGHFLTIMAEKFVPIPGGGFSQGLDSTLPLVGEGVLIGRGLMPPYTPTEKRWQRASAQYRQGGKDRAEKRKISRKFLKDNGLYVFGKELGAPDSEDAMSAILHSLNYMTHVLHHRPTWDTYYTKEG